MANTKIPVELSSTPGIVDGSNATAITIDSSENVGIGAAPTLGALHVTSSLTDIVTFENTDAGTTGAQLILYHNSSSPADGDRVGALNFKGQDDAGNDATYAGIRCLATDVSNTTEDGTLTFSTTRAGTFTEAMRIDNSGNVGIGTTSPDNTLHVDASGGGTIKITRESASTTNFLRLECDGSNGSIVSKTDTIFNNGDAERMRIASDGTLFHGRTSDFYMSAHASKNLVLDGGTTAGELTITSGKLSASTMYHIGFFNANSHVGNISTNGSTTSYTTSSDYRLKENINYNWNGLEKIKNLKPAQFNFKADKNKILEGFIAHEAQEVVPYAVSEEKDKETFQSMDYGLITAVLTKAIQEQQELIETQQTTINDLKSRIETLEG